MLPLLYLHGLSTKDFVPALAEYFGTEAGLSASAVSRLTTSWVAEAQAFMTRDLATSRYVYVWADGVHFNIRLGEDRKLCCLVMVGVRIDGTKELIALADGYRESTESWGDLLRDCKRRGMVRPRAGHRRRRSRVLGGAQRGLPRNPPSEGLVPLCRATDYAEQGPRVLATEGLRAVEVGIILGVCPTLLSVIDSMRRGDQDG